MKEKTDKITKLCKFLNRDPLLIPLPYRAYADLIKGINHDNDSGFLQLDKGKVKIETWMESHHNGDPYDEKVKVIEMTPEMLDHVIDDLTQKALAKMKSDDEHERQRAYEVSLLQRLEFRINQLT